MPQIHGFPAARFIASRLLWVSRLSPLVIIKTPDYKLRFYPTAVSASMFCNPRYFAKDEAILKNILRPGDTFIDVGANIGTLAIYAAKLVGENGQIYAFEPHPRIGNYLRKNAELNGLQNVRTGLCALGSEPGTAFLSNRRSDDQNAVASSGIPVPILTLDQAAPEGPVRLLKIDVEGSELSVLRGAKTVLKRTDYVLFESWEAHFNRHGHTTRDVVSFLGECGFHIDVPEGYKSQQCENLLAHRAQL